MLKTYVLDTNVLLHSPHALFSFQENKIIIPEVVLEELDRFKKDSGELGSNARQVARYLDALRQFGKLNEGIPLDNGGTLKVELNHCAVSLPDNWDRRSPDNRILQVCKGLREQGETVFLITKDIFQRIKADVLDVVAQDFMNEQAPATADQYTGRIEVYTSSEWINEFYSNRSEGLEVGNTYIFDQFSQHFIQSDYIKNQFVLLRSMENSRQTALAYFNGDKIVPLHYLSQRPCGAFAKNAGQRFFQEALYLDSGIAPLVIAKGPAGTGKTFYALAVGLEAVMSHPKAYRKILFCRPNVTMDEEIGFLPGNEQEKLSPMLRGVRDNLEILLDSDDQHRYESEEDLHDKISEIFDRNILCTEAVAYLRGRSITKQWVIIDEAQNLTPKQVKAIITRIGQDTKIILLGDPDQIDHPFLDSRTNGLSYASEKMKGSPYCWQITLTEDECERSALAAESARRM
ncbi:MAG TPA: PhoH family protein [Syntrophomonas sp.]|nr:PhoH family protein [Syntrophomonas sp.]